MDLEELKKKYNKTKNENNCSDEQLERVRDKNVAYLIKTGCDCLIRDGRKCDTDNCVNRESFIECPPECGKECRNRFISRNNTVKTLTVRNTPLMGYGVFATEKIPAGTFVETYVGEVITQEEYESRLIREEYKEFGDKHYSMEIKGLILDASNYANLTRFINNACPPKCNLKTEVWYSEGLPVMTFFASKDIEPGDELLYHYRFTFNDRKTVFHCKCFDETCISSFIPTREAFKSGQRTCRKCIPATNTQYGSYHHLVQHIENHFREEIKCGLCKFKSKNWGSVRNHRSVHNVSKNIFHSEVKEHQCKKCKKTFYRPSEKDKHEDACVNNKKYFCRKKNCNKSYSNMRNRHRHEKQCNID